MMQKRTTGLLTVLAMVLCLVLGLAGAGRAAGVLWPSTGVETSTTRTITLTNASAAWTTTAPALSISGVSGVTLGTPTVVDATHLTVAVTSGSAAGAATITDSTTASSCSLNISTATGGYVLTIDDNFTRPNTARGTAANSTTDLNGWIDFQGSQWSITSNVASGYSATNLPLNGWYRPSGENFARGLARAYFPGSSAGAVLVRFTPGSGGSGYAVLTYNSNAYYVYKAVNGTITTLVSNGSLGVTLPTNIVEEVSASDSGGSTTLTINWYDQAAPGTVLVTKTFTDSSSPIQTAGAWGLDELTITNFKRFVAYKENTSGPMYPGALTQGYTSKTITNLTARESAGGDGTVSYQWQRAAGASGGTFANVSGATGLALRDTGLSAGGTYRYQLVSTDSGGQPQVTSSPLLVTTLPASALILGHIGDSITFGVGSTSLNAASSEILSLQGNGLTAIEGNNGGISGSTTANWAAGTSQLATALTAFQAAEVNVVSVMLGTNDAVVSRKVPAATYASNLSGMIGQILATPGITQVWLNYPPSTNYSVSSGVFDATSNGLLQTYNAQIDALVNGSTVQAGDKVFTAQSLAQPVLLIGTDGTHPTQTGHTTLGDDWAAPIVRKYAYPTIPLRTSGETGRGR